MLPRYSQIGLIKPPPRAAQSLYSIQKLEAGCRGREKQLADEIRRVKEHGGGRDELKPLSEQLAAIKARRSGGWATRGWRRYSAVRVAFLAGAVAPADAAPRLAQAAPTPPETSVRAALTGSPPR